LTPIFIIIGAGEKGRNCQNSVYSGERRRSKSITKDDMTLILHVRHQLELVFNPRKN